MKRKLEESYIRYLIMDKVDDNDPSTVVDIVAHQITEYVEQQRAEVLGWMYAEACASLDKGEDIRQIEVPSILERATKELNVTTPWEKEHDPST